MIKTLNQRGFYKKDIAAKLGIHPKNRQSVAEARKPSEGAVETERQQTGSVQTDDRPPASVRREFDGSLKAMICILSSCFYLNPTLST